MENEFSRLTGIFRFGPDGYHLTSKPMSEAVRENQKAMRRVAMPAGCLVCGKPVARRLLGQGRQRLYCGSKCKWQVHRKPRAKLEVNPCRHCGKPMDGAPQRRYCDWRCKARRPERALTSSG